MKTELSPMSLDDNVEQTDLTPAKDNDGVPYCRSHHCRMKRTSGGKKGAAKAYYACSVEGCEATAQIIKTVNPAVVPPLPLACPRCSKGEQKIFCERDPKASTAASVILRCPSCQWKSSAMVVPQLAAAHFASRRELPPVADVGAR